MKNLEKSIHRMELAVTIITFIIGFVLGGLAMICIGAVR
jgi:hypothetical protein